MSFSSAPASASSGILQESGPREALIAFFLAGSALSLPGTLLPLWGFHMTAEFGIFALYFAAVGLGLAAGIWPGVLIFRKYGLGATLVSGAVAQSLALALLALSGPDRAQHAARISGLVILGLAAGILNTGTFRGSAPLYRLNPAATLHLAALLFGLGAVTTVLIVRFCSDFGAQSTLLALALVPLLFVPLLRHASMNRDSLGDPVSFLREEIRSPGAWLLALVAFFQFASEWCVAGWLPVFLVQRLGRSPADSFAFLALFWASLSLTRVLAHRAVLKLSPFWTVAAMLVCGAFGSLLLLGTDNRFGAGWGILMLAASFAATYPLTAAQIGPQLRSFHPDFFHGIFALAAIGGLFAPSLIGWLAESLGIRVMLAVPAIGSLAVGLLIGIIFLERQMAPAIAVRRLKKP